jgi:hypothetical protein
MTTTNASMTDRYVAAALKGVATEQRTDVAAELRGSIADAVDARVAQGESPDDAERAVLTGLGDPTRLAAEYSGRPLYLIGPAFYPDYIRLLRLLLSIVVPIIAIVVGAASVLAGADPWNVLLGAAGSAFSVGVQLTFWVTLVFALIDRSGAQPRTTTSEWDLDDLPEPPDRRIGLGETVASVTGLALLIWFLLWQPGYQESFDAGGPSIPILDPALSTFWIPVLVAVLLASIALEIVKYRRGHWTIPLSAVNTVLSLAFAIPALWLIVTDQFLNPEFLTAVATGEFASLVDLMPTVAAWVIAVVCVFDIAEGWWKALRASA